MNANAARYARITHRLALGVSSEDDEASQALAELLGRRIVESVAIECAPHVTSDLMSERLTQAVAALREYDIALRLQDGGIVVEACFCGSDACSHVTALLQRLLGVAVESIITNEGQRALVQLA